MEPGHFFSGNAAQAAFTPSGLVLNLLQSASGLMLSRVARAAQDSAYPVLPNTAITACLGGRPARTASLAPFAVAVTVFVSFAAFSMICSGLSRAGSRVFVSGLVRGFLMAVRTFFGDRLVRAFF